MTIEVPALLGPARIRELAAAAQVRPTKTLGQNFVIDAGTVRKIVRLAQVEPGQVVVEIGPGLGSLTTGLLAAGAQVTAVEIDPVLAGLLPHTIVAQAPGWKLAPAAGAAAVVQDHHGDTRLTVVEADALNVTELPDPQPTMLVANLPYNVAVPVLLTFLERFPQLQSVLVMVQAEVADRLAAAPGSRVYGVPSVKAAWYAQATRVATIGRSVFWPVPNVDSALVRLTHHEPPATSAARELVFAVVDTAFAQRRKTLRAALVGRWPGCESAILAAGLDPKIRGERLSVADFARLAQHLNVDDAPQPGTVAL